ncbi:unnamed protein product, partial [Brassica napus]
DQLGGTIREPKRPVLTGILQVIQNRVSSGPAGKIPARISGSRRSLRPESGEEPGGWTSSEENYPLDTAKLGRNLKKS